MFNKNKQAFTLIELLVVVLIIAILTAVALPQYNKAVEKNNLIEAIILGKHLQQLQQLFYLTHGEYAATFREMELEIPAGYHLYGEGLQKHKSSSHFDLERIINGKGHNRFIYYYYGAGRSLILALSFWYNGKTSCTFYNDKGADLCKALKL